MASRKFTFTLPQELAAQFVRRVPASRRSDYVAKAIAAQLRERDNQLARACEIANNSADVLNIETAFDVLSDDADRVHEQ